MNPAVVDRMFPPVPAGQEATVQDERDIIDAKAADLEELLDFNNFVKDHVCESRTDLYEHQCTVVDLYYKNRRYSQGKPCHSMLS